MGFKYDGPGLGKGGRATTMVDGKVAVEGKIEHTVPLRFSADETLDIGEDTGTPVSEDYHVPFKFTGDLKKVMIELSDNKLTPAEEEEIWFSSLMSHQINVFGTDRGTLPKCRPNSAVLLLAANCRSPALPPALRLQPQRQARLSRSGV